jgi:hypothetical protein
LFVDNPSGNTATNVIRNLLVRGNVGLSQYLDYQDRTALLGNPQDKTVIIGTDDINNSTIINQAKKNMEKLCKGMDWLGNEKLSEIDPTVAPNVLCFDGKRLIINLKNDEKIYRNRTIIVKGSDAD